MKAKEVQITRHRGDTYPITFTAKSGRESVDVAGYSAILSVSTEENPASDSYLFQITGTLDADTTTGKIHFTPTWTQANNLGEYYYDVQVTDVAGKVRTPVKGKFTFEQDITK